MFEKGNYELQLYSITISLFRHVLGDPCQPLSNPERGDIICYSGSNYAVKNSEEYTEGDLCVTACSTAYAVNPYTSTYRYCLSDGAWTGAEPTCERKFCVCIYLCMHKFKKEMLMIIKALHEKL